MKSIIIGLFVLITNVLNSQSLGDFYQGGVVYYVNNIGKGLIVDSSYLEAVSYTHLTLPTILLV